MPFSQKQSGLLSALTVTPLIEGSVVFFLSMHALTQSSPVCCPIFSSSLPCPSPRVSVHEKDGVVPMNEDEDVSMRTITGFEFSYIVPFFKNGT